MLLEFVSACESHMSLIRRVADFRGFFAKFRKSNQKLIDNYSELIEKLRDFCGFFEILDSCLIKRNQFLIMIVEDRFSVRWNMVV